MVLVALGVVAAVGACLRFVTSSPLWLDEALSVNIARPPLDEVSGALRRDGHPPLFYLLLHGWIAAVGDSDLAVRALSGLWAVALLPLVWIAGRRVGGRRTAACTVVILALSPFAVRYATEARMYAMVSVLALVGWLAADSAWRRPGLVPLAGVAVCSALLLWTHYWSIWFLAVGASLLAVLAWRANAGGDRAARSAALRILAAVGVGGLTFAPWLPTLWYQRAHTGTPWTRPSRPAEVLSTLASDLGGGGTGEAAVLGWLVLVLAAGGLWLRVSTPWELTADLRRPRGPAALSMAVLAGGTLVVGGLGGSLTGAGFASRYASVVLPFVVVLAATAVAELRPRALGVSVLGLIGLLSSLGLARNVTDDRSDARRNAEAITAAAEPGDLVVYCPDQSGPATARELGDGFEQVTFPVFAPPDLVDWVDYAERNAAVSPETFASEVLERAEGRSVFLVYSVAVHSHRDICPAVFDELGRVRRSEVLTTATESPEPAGVVRFAAGP
ncbi:MAG TPA: glycosyltransferase family 39 protein [Acidimicrobiales bacterium]|nr:glycosyltransferase family 39 protein [Acidimicrobiales bacterium]